MNIQDKKLEVSYLSLVLLRVMLSFIFIVASINHLFNTEKTVHKLEVATMGFLGKLLGPPELAIILSGIVMLMAGFSLLIGFKTRFAAILLITLLIPITVTVQVGQTATLGPLFKNVAILGGLLFFSINSNLKNQKQ
ncbi:DoxX family protein [Flavobacterium ovatum]|uniref:DoxX family protein n=1 Tax=Flavobacterium ovatum TaxID=1928857 RepID=UPI00344B90CE